MMFIYFLAIIIIKSTPAYSVPDKGEASSKASEAQIDHSDTYLSEIQTLCLEDNLSDVVLLVGGLQKIHAHRLVLALNSGFFRACFFGQGKEKSEKEVFISLEGASIDSFKIFLQYVYTGKLDLSNLVIEEVLDLFGLSNHFDSLELFHALTKYLEKQINEHNVLMIFVHARFIEQKELTEASLNFIDSHASDVLKSDKFNSVPPEAIQEILARDTFSVDELEIYRAVCGWIKANQNDRDPDARRKVLSNVRTTLIKFEVLVSVFKETGMDDSAFYEYNNLSDILPSRIQQPARQQRLSSIQERISQ